MSGPVDGGCPRCGRARATTTVAREATAGTVRVRAERLLVRRCPHDHEPGAADPGWRRAVTDAVDEQLPTADGHWLRADTCSRCGAALTMPARRTRQSVTAVLRAGTTPATLTFDLPRTRCPECAADLVPVGAAADVTAAVETLWEG